MKQIKLIALFAVIVGLAAAGQAQTVIALQDFNSNTNGNFTNPYNFGGGPVVAIITNGTVNGVVLSGNAVEYSGPAAASGDNYGVRGVGQNLLILSNNVSTVITNYTLEFDMALSATSVNDFTADFVLYGIPSTVNSGWSTGADFPVNGSANLPIPGNGFKHYTFPFPATPGGWHLDPLDMTANTNLQWSVGKQNGTTVGTADVFVDNIKITFAGLATNSPVTITTQPTSQTAFAGQAALFSVGASGFPAPAYQWFTNGVGVAGATGSSFVLTATTNLNGVLVTVLVSNTVPSSVLSTNNVTLTVVPASGLMVFSSLFASPTANTGYLQGYGTFRVTNGYPVVSTKVPTGSYAPTANSASVDFGSFTDYTNQPGGRGINFQNTINASGTPVGNLGAMSAFTVCAWVNCASADQGAGGNRIVYCNDSSSSVGFDLTTALDPFGNVVLQLGVNSWGDYPAAGPKSGNYTIPVDPANGAGNWVFVAVSYDGTLTSQNVTFYQGDGNNQAQVDWTTDYNRGPIKNSSMLSIGNANLNTSWSTSSGTNAAAYRSWRGLIDEVHVYNSVLSLQQIQAAQVAPSSTNVVVIAPTSVPLKISSSGSNVILSWTDATGLFKLATSTNLTSITNVVSTTSPYTNAVSGSQKYFRLIYP